MDDLKTSAPQNPSESTNTPPVPENPTNLTTPTSGQVSSISSQINSIASNAVPNSEPNTAPQNPVTPEVSNTVPQIPTSSVEQINNTAQQLGNVTQQFGNIAQNIVNNENLKQMFQASVNQPKVTTEEKAWALISYIPLVALLCLIIKGNSNYVKLHSRQGLLLFILFFLTIFVYILPFVGLLLGSFIQLLIFILGAFSAYQALIGNWWKIPVLGDIAEMIPVDLFVKIASETLPNQTTTPPSDQTPPQV